MEQFVPTEFAWEFARAESEYIPSVAYVALRDIEEGEELFYDYEWEYNISNIQYSSSNDILMDWPWYRPVPQSDMAAFTSNNSTVFFATSPYKKHRISDFLTPLDSAKNRRSSLTRFGTRKRAITYKNHNCSLFTRPENDTEFPLL